MNRLLLGTAVLTVILTVGIASAEEGEGGPGRGDFMFEAGMPPPGMMVGGDAPGLMLPLLMRRADLSPEQRQAVHGVMQNEHHTLRGLFQDLRQANDALADKLLAPGTVDASTLQPEIQRVSAVRQQLMEQAVKTSLAVRAVLTPEQLAKAAATKDRMRQLQAEMRTLMEGR